MAKIKQTQQQAEIFAYLHGMKQGTTTSVYSAVPHLMHHFKISRHDARVLMFAWLDKFDVQEKD